MAPQRAVKADRRAFDRGHERDTSAVEMRFQSSSAPANLASLAIGESARVESVEGAGKLGVRLMEMGFVPGAQVELIKRAPLGDPLELRLRGYHVSLRRAEAACIRVEAHR